jgi:hypothetical protein
MSRLVATTLAAACLAACVSTAQADTVKLTGYTYSPASAVDVSINLSGRALDLTYSGKAGEFTGTLNGASFTTYCLDLYENFSFGTTYTDYHAASIAADVAYDMGRLITKYSGMVDDAVESAAFQVALWEITYETDSNYNLQKGSFRETDADGKVRELAQSWLSDLGTQNNVQVSKLESDGYYSSRHRWVAGHQDFLVVTPITTPVPEPSTYALLAAGLLGIGFVARRRIPQR